MINHEKYYFKYYLIIIVVSCAFFLPFLGSVHLFDWDEINFAESAREMIATGDYITVRIDYLPFHEKPPFFIWMQVVSMKIFGVNEFAARFPNAVIGLITMMVLFSIGRKIYNQNIGIYWVLSYFGSVLPNFYFKTGIIDPTFNLFIFLGLYFLYKLYSANNDENKIGKITTIILASLFTGLAIMTKGPVAFLITLISWLVFVIITRKRNNPKINLFIFYSFLSFIPFILWYLALAMDTNGDILSKFLEYQLKLFVTEDAGHGGPFYYHFIVILFGCFPASVIMLQGFKKELEFSVNQNDFKLLMIILFLVVLLLFSIVKTKIVHYSSLTYIPLCLLSALSIDGIIKGKIQFSSVSRLALIFIGVIWSFILTALPLIMMNIKGYLHLVDDKFTLAVIKADVDWSGFDLLPGIFYFLIIVITVIFLIKKNYRSVFVTIFAGTAIMIFLLLPIIIPKVEAYTQNAPVEFEKSLQNKDCYLYVDGFKSYAQYYYTQKKINNSAAGNNMKPETWDSLLLNAEVNKSVYLITKVQRKEKILRYPNFNYIYEKNGFVFFYKKQKE